MPGHSVFSPWKPSVYAPSTLKSLEEFLANTKPDLAIFGGGQDINPHLYQHENYGSHVPRKLEPNGRDLYERAAWNMLRAKDIPILGICRGAQLACVLSGGALYQHVDGHAGKPHEITIAGEEGTWRMSSVHHQMMAPWDVPNHEMLAWTSERQSDQYMWGGPAGSYKQPDREPEIVFFKDQKTLAVQGHPEFMDPMERVVVKVRQMVNTMFLNGAEPNV